MLEDYEINRIKHELSNSNNEVLKKLVLELIKERQQLINSVNTDYLTGAYSKRALEDVKTFGIAVMCDIDSFKSVNDTYGHRRGDMVLKLVVDNIKGHIRMDDKVFRYGGDEFLILFNCNDMDIIINRIQEIQQKIFKSSRDLKTTLSFGIAPARANIAMLETIHEADMALYESKQQGKGKISIYNASAKSKILK